MTSDVYDKFKEDWEASLVDRTTARKVCALHDLTDAQRGPDYADAGMEVDLPGATYIQAAIRGFDALLVHPTDRQVWKDSTFLAPISVAYIYDGALNIAIRRGPTLSWRIRPAKAPSLDAWMEASQ